MGVPVVDQLVSICYLLSSCTLYFLPRPLSIHNHHQAALLFTEQYQLHNPPPPFHSSPSHSNPPLSTPPLTISPPPSRKKETTTKPTLLPPQPIPHTNPTIPKLALRRLELAERRRQMLQFLRELVLHVCELGRGEGGEVDCVWGGVFVSSRLWRTGEGRGMWG